LSCHCASSPKGSISIPEVALLDLDLTLFSRFRVCNKSSDSFVPGIGAFAVLAGQALTKAHDLQALPVLSLGDHLEFMTMLTHTQDQTVFTDLFNYTGFRQAIRARIKRIDCDKFDSGTRFKYGRYRFSTSNP
jgi:hypothetical protein